MAQLHQAEDIQRANQEEPVAIVLTCARNHIEPLARFVVQYSNVYERVGESIFTILN